MTPFLKRGISLLALLIAALVSYLLGVTVFVGLFVVGLLFELLFWAGLLFTDWKGLKRTVSNLPAER